MVKHDYSEFDDLLKQGFTVRKASNVTGIIYGVALRRAHKIGWDKTWRSKPVRDIVFRKIKISDEEILRKHDNGESRKSIAEDAGCSRERIRQILKQNRR